MFGLGKPRSSLGRWLDRNEISQRELERWTGLNKSTISILCNDEDYEPSELTMRSVIRALWNKGFDKVDEDDFW